MTFVPICARFLCAG